MQLCEEMAISRQDGYDEGREAGYDEGKEAGYDEGRKAGYSEGREAGYDEGQQYARVRINALNQKLMEDNRTEDLLRAIEDTAYQEQLLKEYCL
jgi:flagellar biosynthesis/type III secretory pathway protein FliH